MKFLFIIYWKREIYIYVFFFAFDFRWIYGKSLDNLDKLFGYSSARKTFRFALDTVYMSTNARRSAMTRGHESFVHQRRVQLSQKQKQNRGALLSPCIHGNEFESVKLPESRFLGLGILRGLYRVSRRVSKISRFFITLDFVSSPRTSSRRRPLILFLYGKHACYPALYADFQGNENRRRLA